MHKLNPFTEFTISLGPLYVDRLFDSMLIKNGLPDLAELPIADKIQGYIVFLNKGTQKYGQKAHPFLHFYTAHFYQQLAERTIDIEAIQKYREEALFHYHSYLKLNNGSGESSYYAQWQIGRLQSYFNYPWPIVKNSFLKANMLDPIRGEAINNIIRQYVAFGEWENAYAYSMFAKTRYFNRNPIAMRRWYVDADCYNGNILDTHITICKNLNYWPEAERVYRQLLNYVVEHLHEFQKIEKHLLQMVEEMFSGDKLNKIYQEND